MNIGQHIRILDGLSYDGQVCVIAAIDDDCIYAEVGDGANNWWMLEPGEFELTDEPVTVKQPRQRTARVNNAQYLRERYADLKEQRLCVKCGAASDGGIFCPHHAARDRVRRKKGRAA